MSWRYQCCMFSFCINFKPSILVLISVIFPLWVIISVSIETKFGAGYPAILLLINFIQCFSHWVKFILRIIRCKWQLLTYILYNYVFLIWCNIFQNNLKSFCHHFRIIWHLTLRQTFPRQTNLWIQHRKMFGQCFHCRIKHFFLGDIVFLSVTVFAFSGKIHLWIVMTAECQILKKKKYNIKGKGQSVEQLLYIFVIQYIVTFYL